MKRGAKPADSPSAGHPMTIQVTINGRSLEIAETITIASYLEEKGLLGRRLAVAHNGSVVTSGRYDEVTIDDGDTVEIVRPVGGG